MYAESNVSQQSTGKQVWRESHSGASQDISKIPSRQALHCANCDIEILWPPTIVAGKSYCCTGCAAGGPCNCDYSQYTSVNISGVIHYTNDQQN